MDRELRKRIIDRAFARAVEVFRQSVMDKDGEVSFEKEFGKLEDVFLDEILMAGNEVRIPSDERYDIHYGGWNERCKALKARCREELLRIQKECAVTQIRIATAESLIEPQVRRIGYPYRMEYQKYRIKVILRLDWTHVFTFYVRYRDFGNEKIISGIPERTRDAVEYIRMYGPQVSLRENSFSGGWRSPEDKTDDTF